MEHGEVDEITREATETIMETKHDGDAGKQLKQWTPYTAAMAKV